MKFFSIAITAFLLSSPSYGLEESSNQQGCIDPATFNAETDYFPDKAVVEESKYWTIEYRKSYKIITNKGAGETYLLYQCGTEPPADEMEAGHTAVVPVPIQNGVAFTGAIHLTHLELLGLRTEITGYLSSTDYLSSDCALDLIENGEILNILNTTDEDALKGLLTEDGGEPIIFKGAWSNVAMFKNQITVSESYENTNFGTFEWHKFYATFFNLEAEANKQYQQSQERYACMEENAAIATADTPKPTLLWAYYSTYSKGWSVGKCPNYYCEYAQACSANILDSTGGNWSVPVPGYDGVFDLSLDEILEFGKDADYWIYPSNDWQDVYSTNKEVLDEFKSVQNKKVYDYLGVGEDAWWGERRAEADVVLTDVCSVVGTSGTEYYKRRWLRNVYSEPAGTPEQCQDTSAPLVTSATPCTKPDTVEDANPNDENPKNDTIPEDTNPDDANPDDNSSKDSSGFKLASAAMAVFASTLSLLSLSM